MEGNIEGNEDGAGGSGTQKAGKVERKRFAGQKKVKEFPWKPQQGENEIRTHLETNDAEEDDDGDNEDAYLIIVTDATDAVSVNFSGRCKFLLI